MLIREQKSNRKAQSRVLDLPEFNVVIFAYMLNFLWEFWQVPFFGDMATAAHWEAIKFCTRATAGDVGIMLVAFWIVSIAVKSRTWVRNPGPRNVVGFVSVGVVITIFFEWLATNVLDRWVYAESMPTLPILGTGLIPLVQWVLIPPLVLWFVRRQLT